jgi:hypothetical protein
VIPAIVGRGREIELRQGATLDVMFEQPVPLRE